MMGNVFGCVLTCLTHAHLARLGRHFRITARSFRLPNRPPRAFAAARGPGALVLELGDRGHDGEPEVAGSTGRQVSEITEHQHAIDRHIVIA
jgi:hypothetical protein